MLLVPQKLLSFIRNRPFEIPWLDTLGVAEVHPVQDICEVKDELTFSPKLPGLVQVEQIYLKQEVLGQLVAVRQTLQNTIEVAGIPKVIEANKPKF